MLMIKRVNKAKACSTVVLLCFQSEGIIPRSSNREQPRNDALIEHFGGLLSFDSLSLSDKFRAFCKSTN